MLRLRDIMTTAVETVEPDLSIRAAMELFADRHISGAPVVDGGKVIGVVSATDLLGFAASLADVTEGAPAEDAASRGRENGTGWDEETEPSAGYFSALWQGVDLGEALAADPEAPERNALDEHTVAEAMTRSTLHRMSPDTPVESAAEHMRRAEIHRVIVMDGDKLVGIVSTMDIVKAVGRHQLTALRYVFGAPQHGAPPRP